MNPDSKSHLPDGSWYYTDGENAVGPLPFSSLLALQQAGVLTDESLITPEGSEDWKPLGDHLAAASPAPALTPEEERKAVRTGCTVLVLVALAIGSLLTTCFDKDEETDIAKPQSTLEKLMKSVYGSELREAKAHEIVMGEQTGKLNVYVKVNADLESSSSVNMYTMEDKMRKAFKAVYTSGLPAWEVTIWNYGELVDRYGNKSDEIVYKVTLHSREASRVNWKNTNAVSFERIWEVNFKHPALER